VIAIGLFLFDDWELGILIGALAITVIWAIFGWLGARKENGAIFIFFFAFAIVEPCYLIARTLYMLIEKQPGNINSSAIFPLAAIATLALVTRILSIIWGVFSRLHFGSGLKDHVFDKEESLPIFTA